MEHYFLKPLTPTYEDFLKCCDEAKPTVNSSDVEILEKFAKKQGEWCKRQQKPAINSAPSWDEQIYDIFCTQ